MFLFILLVSLCCCLGPAAAQGEGTYLHTSSGLHFPAKIGQLQRSKMKEFEDKSLGWAATYNNPDSSQTVTVYVYPAQGAVFVYPRSPGMHVGGQSKFLGEWLEADVAMTKANNNPQEHRQQRRLSEDSWSGGKCPEVAQVVYALEEKGARVGASMAVLTVYKDNFLKLRVTVRGEADIEATAHAFLSSLDWGGAAPKTALPARPKPQPRPQPLALPTSTYPTHSKPKVP